MMVSTATKIFRIIDQRIRSLVDDGYIEVSYTDMTYFIFAKLRHRTNGNVVTITAYPHMDKMVQKTNGKVTYSGTIQA